MRPPYPLLSVLLLTILITLIIGTSSSNKVRAASSDGTHCTDWPSAGQATAGQNPSLQDSIYNTFAFSNRLLNDNIITPSDAGAHWRMLLRPGSIFAVFYTETSAANNHLLDPATGGVTATPAGNYDEDRDGVPDFAERVYHCLDKAHERYRVPFAAPNAEAPSTRPPRTLGLIASCPVVLYTPRLEVPLPW